MSKIGLIVLCLLLHACSVGPNYKEPAKKAMRHWLDKNHMVTEKHHHDASWWKVFKDPVLNSLIERGYKDNITAHIAGVRVLQARALLAQTVGFLYPQQQTVSSNYLYNRIGGNSLAAILPSDFLSTTLGFNASWEIDFWGKYRRAIEAHDALFLSSIAAYDNIIVSLIADIASTYIQIRTYEAMIVVTQKNIRLQKKSLQIAGSRFRAGETSLLDVEQAQTELAQTEATLPSQIASLRQYKDKLGVLLGTTPHEVDTLKKGSIPQAPLHIAAGIPRETLAQRPDIHQARLEAIAQSANIGAVKANLYPAFSLSGTFAFAATNIGSSSIKDLFHWQNHTITAGPGFNWPILNYGQITNAVRAQDALFQEALLKYLALILKAEQEIQDNITLYIQAKKSLDSLKVANKAAIKSTQLALLRYKDGQSNYTTVLDVERQQLQVQTALIKAQGELPLAVVALYRALGGGWQIRKCQDVVPTTLKTIMAKRTNWGNLLKKSHHLPPLHKEAQYLPNW